MTFVASLYVPVSANVPPPLTSVKAAVAVAAACADDATTAAILITRVPLWPELPAIVPVNVVAAAGVAVGVVVGPVGEPPPQAVNATRARARTRGLNHGLMA